MAVLFGQRAEREDAQRAASGLPTPDNDQQRQLQENSGVIVTGSHSAARIAAEEVLKTLTSMGSGVPPKLPARLLNEALALARNTQTSISQGYNVPNPIDAALRNQNDKSERALNDLGATDDARHRFMESMQKGMTAALNLDKKTFFEELQNLQALNHELHQRQQELQRAEAQTRSPERALTEERKKEQQLEELAQVALESPNSDTVRAKERDEAFKEFEKKKFEEADRVSDTPAGRAIVANAIDKNTNKSSVEALNLATKELDSDIQGTHHAVNNLPPQDISSIAHLGNILGNEARILGSYIVGQGHHSNGSLGELAAITPQGSGKGMESPAIPT